MEILTPLWPEVIVGMAVTLDRISELLGQDHDLAELLQALADRPDLCPNPLGTVAHDRSAEQRRADLQTASRILGRRIYAENTIGLGGPHQRILGVDGARPDHTSWSRSPPDLSSQPHCGCTLVS